MQFKICMAVSQMIASLASTVGLEGLEWKLKRVQDAK
jgi:hypothetical protein